MAETIWQSTDGDWGTAGSWTNGVPSSTKTPAVFDGRVQTSAVLSMNQSAQSFELITMPAYSGNVGSAGNPLTWSGSGAATRHVLRGSGKHYLSTNLSNSDIYIVDSPNVLNAAWISAKFERLVVKRGHVTLPPAHTWAGRLYIDGPYATVDMAAKASAEANPTYCYVEDGTFLCARDIETAADQMTIGGGLINMTGVLHSGVNVDIQGGTFKYAPATSASGKAPHVAVMNGVFDVSECDQTLGWGSLIVGRNGHIEGDFAGQTVIPTLDLRQDYPGG